jgi:hypothetical protein
VAVRPYGLRRRAPAEIDRRIVIARSTAKVSETVTGSLKNAVVIGFSAFCIPAGPARAASSSLSIHCNT